MTDTTTRDLDIARGLVAAGVPVFVAPPCPSTCERKDHKPGAGVGGTGYHLPPKWETTTVLGDQVDRWQPGWALCLVMGHAVDLLDVDPRNGGDATVAGLKDAGAWPRSYGRAATPSGGTHDLIASLRVRSLDGLASGLDVKSGAPDGAGRGFAFIAPTVKKSKTNGELARYRWLVEPDLTGMDGDDSGTAVAGMIAAKRNGKAPAGVVGDGFDWDDFTHQAGPWVDIAATLADNPRRDAVFKLASALRGRGGWRAGDALALMRVLIWPRIDQDKGGHPFPWEEFEANVTSAFEQHPDGHSTEDDQDDATPRGRRVDLTPWLDGTWTPPEPDRGALRDDGRALLCAGKWHTCIGPNESGKTWMGLVHARDELHAGNTVVWAHFEEFDAGGTVTRLLALGVRPDVIRERFVWLDCGRAWTAVEFAAELVDLPRLTLVGLDGINAACTGHGHDPEKPTAVGWYRKTFVTPAVRAGAAVLSLGHPVKDKTRQGERHGFGSSAWLDEVDGVGFRLLPGRAPIRRGGVGAASLYSVKDRYGSVTPFGVRDSREGWIYLGSLVIDDSHGGGNTSARLSVPERDTPERATAADPIDALAAALVAALAPDGGGEVRFDSERDLRAKLRAGKVTFANDDLEPALMRLEVAARLKRDPYVKGRARGGWVLTDPRQDQEDL